MPYGTMCNVAANSWCIAGPATRFWRMRASDQRARRAARMQPRRLQITALKGADGQFSPTPFVSLASRTRLPAAETLVSAEQTRQIGGGTIWKKGALERGSNDRQVQGLATIWTARRLMKGCVGPHQRPATWGGVGCPHGSISQGPGSAIGGRTRRHGRLHRTGMALEAALGGSMRQAGIARAACGYALDHHSNASPRITANARDSTSGRRRSQESRYRSRDQSGGFQARRRRHRRDKRAPNCASGRLACRDGQPDQGLQHSSDRTPMIEGDGR